MFHTGKCIQIIKCFLGYTQTARFALTNPCKIIACWRDDYLNTLPALGSASGRESARSSRQSHHTCHELPHASPYKTGGSGSMAAKVPNLRRPAIHPESKRALFHVPEYHLTCHAATIPVTIRLPAWQLVATVAGDQCNGSVRKGHDFPSTVSERAKAPAICHRGQKTGTFSGQKLFLRCPLKKGIGHYTYRGPL